MHRGGSAAIPKIGDFAVMEEMMIKTMSYASLRRPGLADIALNTRELIDNHCKNYKVYLAVLEEVRSYSELFGVAGNLSTFLKEIIAMLPAKLVRMLNPSLPVSSTPDLPPSTN